MTRYLVIAALLVSAPALAQDGDQGLSPADIVWEGSISGIGG